MNDHLDTIVSYLRERSDGSNGRKRPRRKAKAKT
jgi:hypothetical protein